MHSRSYFEKQLLVLGQFTAPSDMVSASRLASALVRLRMAFLVAWGNIFRRRLSKFLNFNLKPIHKSAQKLIVRGIQTQELAFDHGINP
jgi:hypothetical protein